MPTVDLTAATETDAAQALTNYAEVTLSYTHETNAIPAFRWQAGPAKQLSYDKSPELGSGLETDEAVTFIVTHVISKNLTPVEETDSAEAFTKITGAVQYKTVTPVGAWG